MFILLVRLLDTPGVKRGKMESCCTLLALAIAMVLPILKPMSEGWYIAGRMLTSMFPEMDAHV